MKICSKCGEENTRKKSDICKKCWRKEYNEKNSEHIKEVNQKRYLKNREENLKKSKEWGQNNSEHVAKRRRESYWKHVENERTRRLTNYHFGHLKKSSNCQVCEGDIKLDFHHIPPYRYDRFIITCKDCHRLIEGKLIITSDKQKQLLEKANRLIEKIKNKSFDGNDKKTPKITREELLKLIWISKYEHHKLAYILEWNFGLKPTDVLNLNKEYIDIKKIKVPENFNIKSLDIMPLRNIFKIRALQKAFTKDCKTSGLLETKPNVKFISLSQSKNVSLSKNDASLAKETEGEDGNRK